MRGTDDEIREFESTQPRVAISIYFQGQTGLPQTVQKQLIKTFMRYRQHPHDSDAKSLLDEFAEVGVKGALHDRGYFRAKVETEAKLLGVDGQEQRYSFVISIAKGSLYRLGTVHFANAADPHSALAFPSAELRNLVPLARGDVFNVSKIRQGLEAITKLYGSNGYVDATIEPDTQVDDDRPIIDLVLNIDEQSQYRIGKVLVVSTDTNVKSFVSANLKTGQVFNKEVIEQLLRRYKSVLPADVSERDISIARNTVSKRLNITFDFWTCPLR
jgi:hypothetical protein